MQSEFPAFDRLANNPLFQLFPQLREALAAQPGFAEMMFLLNSGQAGGPGGDIVDQFFEAYTPPGPPPTAKDTLAELEQAERPLEAADLVDCKECPICMEEYTVGDRALPLPCHHAFHKDCVLTWLREHNTCPTCRHELPAAEAAPKPAAPAEPAFMQGFRGVFGAPQPTDDMDFSEAEMQEAIRLSLLEAERNKPLPSGEELRVMPVRELKERLRQRGVDYSSVLEKEELVELLRRSYD
eukprot:EG_transcript_13667